MMTTRIWFLLGLAWVFLASAAMIGQTPRDAQADEGHVDDNGSHVPEKLGTIHFPISCDPTVQEDFNRGVALLHHFATQPAEELFTALLEKDPHCAMGYWGAAMALRGNPLAGAPAPEALARGLNMVERARPLAKTEREQLYIAAAAAYYEDYHRLNHKARLRNWETATERLYLHEPDDLNAAAFYSIALTVNADRADKTYAQQLRAGEIAEQIAAKEPNHPAVYHYIIHAYDHPGLAERALAAAHKYDRVAPEVAHTLHMPSHIFTRLGMWEESVTWNLRSVASAKAAGENRQNEYDFAHGVDYLAYAYLQTAQDRSAAELIPNLESAQHQHHFAVAFAMAAVPARVALERHQWAEAARVSILQAEVFPWKKFPNAEAIVHFARGLGSARSGDANGALPAIAALDSLHERLHQAGSSYWAKQVDIQRLAVQAWQAFEEGRRDEAVHLMRRSAELESSTEKSGVTPGAILPSRELFGDMLMELDRPEEALAQYKAALARSPNRFNSLLGAGLAAERLSDAAMARDYYAKLVEMCARSESDRVGLIHARSFLGRAG